MIPPQVGVGLFGRIERAALRVLAQELGWWDALRVGLATRRAPDPFADLPPPRDAREVGSRAQAGPAVVLYRALRAQHGGERALEVTGRVVEACAIVFLADSLGPLRRAELAALDVPGRQRFATERAARFPNAELQWDEISADRVRFTVTRCRLVELVRHAGEPALAPLFCRGDARYFGGVEPGVHLERPTTLAEGGASCPFTLEWTP